jgi:glycosyltransferase involved in cell wall biosynthesis
VQQCQQVITVSKAVKEDIIQYLDVPETKVSIISGGVDPTVFYSRVGIHHVLQRFDLESPYCLYVGLGHAHKRLPWLLQAFVQVQEHLPLTAKLVIVGGQADLYARAFEAISTYQLEKRIVFTGAVSDEALACLYSGAAAIIVSSLEEGFCLPALETLACQREVIVPDIAVLRETVGLAGHYYEVDNQKQLGKYLIEAFNGTLERKALLFQNRFNWDLAAQNMLLLFDQLLSRSGKVNGGQSRW